MLSCRNYTKYPVPVPTCALPEQRNSRFRFLSHRFCLHSRRLRITPFSSQKATTTGDSPQRILRYLAETHRFLTKIANAIGVPPQEFLRCLAAISLVFHCLLLSLLLFLDIADEHDAAREPFRPVELRRGELLLRIFQPKGHGLSGRLLRVKLDFDGMDAVRA